MSVFDFPTWAYTKLAGKPEEPAKVQPMPTPTLDEIEAMQKAGAIKADIRERCAEIANSFDAAVAESLPKRKPGRPRKPTGAME